VEVSRSGHVGVPAAGLELKLTPVAGKLEARLRGPNITPGYWGQEELTKAAFDEEGFYRMGDALLFVDENDPSKGFVFDGRIGILSRVGDRMPWDRATAALPDRK
jgi:feruloyl-CoA synthase